MTRRSRIWALLLVGVAIVALVFLAAAFGDLELTTRGQALAQPTQQEPIRPAGPLSSPLLAYLYMALFVIGMLSLPILIVWVIRSPKARKELLQRMVPILMMLAFFMAARLWTDSSEELDEQAHLEPPLEGAIPPSLEDAAPPLDAEAGSDLPPWAVWATTLTLGALVAGGLVVGAWFVWRRAGRPATPLEQLAQDAQQAIDSLLDGADLRDTVIRCYLAMSRTLQRHKGIRRDEDMTPREFEISLAEAGLPEPQVRQLTRLFEAARYGARAPQEDEARQAIGCLTVIVEACRSAP